LELCESERIGIIPIELQHLKAEAGDDPNHTFPLRDVDVQFSVEYKRGSQKRTLGSLSYAQLMREAYPGAVYYYTTKPYRVYRVKNSSRVIEVRHEKRYTTRPQTLPTLVFPNLSEGNVFEGQKYGELVAVECNLQIREAIAGIKERRGPNETITNYPLAPSLGFFFDQNRFTRNYFTTGVVIAHPALNSPGVHSDIIARLLFEAFLIIVPLERRDINFSSDKYRTNVGVIDEGNKFICIYDQTYGSLRLSGHILEKKQLKLIGEKAFELSRCNESIDINPETVSALEETVDSLSKSWSNISFNSSKETDRPQDELFKKVIRPGSKGLDIKKNNEEFFIDDVFYSPVVGGLTYRGKHSSEQTTKYDGINNSIPVDSLVEIPGESKTGLYDFETGEIREIVGI
jgi:DEAD/DEAH box helicase domain-containing protein